MLFQDISKLNGWRLKGWSVQCAPLCLMIALLGVVQRSMSPRWGIKGVGGRRSSGGNRMDKSCTAIPAAIGSNCVEWGKKPGNKAGML